jgi:hypothetical protein
MNDSRKGATHIVYCTVGQVRPQSRSVPAGKGFEHRLRQHFTRVYSRTRTYTPVAIDSPIHWLRTETSLYPQHKRYITSDPLHAKICDYLFLHFVVVTEKNVGVWIFVFATRCTSHTVRVDAGGPVSNTAAVPPLKTYIEVTVKCSLLRHT